MRYYTAIIEDAGGNYSVYFPDLPGCTAAGDTLQDAAREAMEAAQIYVSEMAGGGFEIAEPSDSIDAEGISVLIPVEMPGKVERVNISFDSSVLALIDRMAEKSGQNRSSFLAMLALKEKASAPASSKARVIGTKRDRAGAIAAGKKPSKRKSA
jgi:predicted RNase H-like HicB family nuclease/uncharacterized protein (DUF1778 family)